MRQPGKDLLEEVECLRDLVLQPRVRPLGVTPFYNWRVRDTIAHLVTIDRLALLSLIDVATFKIEMGIFAAGVRSTDPSAPNEDVFRRIAAQENRTLSHLSWADLLLNWFDGAMALRDAAQEVDPDDKVEWFGPPMRARALFAARQMEVWAYGQDIFDCYGQRRPEGDRLRNVVDFAARTFGFSFANRGLAIPSEKPFLQLRSPTGGIWELHDSASPSRITGTAVDFCLVATQRRNVRDTGLKVEGDVGIQWMNIAQCITGAPIDPPRPGERMTGAAKATPITAQ